MPRAPRPPRFYFNLRSPYNFLALKRLRERHPGLLDRLEFRPFWEPDARSEKALAEAGATFPYTPMNRAKQFYILHDVRRLAAAEGIALTWPVDAGPWWEPAHLAWFLARDAGLGRAWIERASEARWLEGRDICDPAVVRELAAEVGLDAEAVAGVPEDPELRERGVKALLDVVRDGVFGVPYFVNGSQPFWGLDRVEEFAASFGPAAAPAPPAPASVPAAEPRSFDLSHAGGCG
ncbi:DsbA family protein [Streptomyces sp. NPDC002248]|uniref:2-hydroxychromene-2-carboxylate isomerase n=1 Tax=Streptomyces sp. GZWMJZ-114 TaxID=2494734 RepID=UPI0010120711|nr:DsbA family protein [Streptomyces sp. GZWMJZ-114]